MDIWNVITAIATAITALSVPLLGYELRRKMLPQTKAQIIERDKDGWYLVKIEIAPKEESWHLKRIRAKNAQICRCDLDIKANTLCHVRNQNDHSDCLVVDEVIDSSVFGGNPHVVKFFVRSKSATKNLNSSITFMLRYSCFPIDLSSKTTIKTRTD